MGRRNGRRLRFYEFTDLPPSLPLCRRDAETRTYACYESNHRRRVGMPLACPSVSRVRTAGRVFMNRLFMLSVMFNKGLCL